MGERNYQRPVRKGATQHLQNALEIEDSTEKDFHVKQALQLLDIQIADD